MSNKGFFRRIADAFKKPSVRWGAGTLLAGGFVVGIIFWISFDSFVTASSRMEMCYTCHEMREYIFPEFEESVHYLSRSGVRPICDDCHVPKDFLHKIGAKIRAVTVEVPSHFLGTIDTREKFEAKREELAKRVWARFEANDSAPCRKCHHVEFMDKEAQSKRAVRKHEEGFAAGQTCIDCHKGIAHHLPKAMLERQAAEEAESVDFDF